MAMTGLERKALFKAAVTLRELTMAEAAAKLGVSYNHLILVLRGDRIGSTQLERRIAQFVGRATRDLFGDGHRDRQDEVGRRDRRGESKDPE